MKKHIAASLFCGLLSAAVFASTTPKVVQQTFTEKFPTAMDVKWENNNSKVYEAEFLLSDVKTVATFSPDGKWLETETEIELKELPEGTERSVAMKYPEAVIFKAEKVESAAKGNYFEVEFKNGEKIMEASIDKEGNLK